MTVFDQVAAVFWGTGREDLLHDPLTDEMVAEAERLLGLALPTELLRLLRIRNGGAVADACRAYPLGTDKYVLFSHMVGIGLDPDVASMLNTPYLIEERKLPSSIVLIEGDGHYWVALDYRECGPGGEPAVVRLQNDGACDERLAPDFRRFITGLRPFAKIAGPGRSEI
ncbi:SMI1/KNR4 family protein [Actinoplanes sp. NPDC020271]|uniref:SMI1/KNR4 family protein n=1 Tax=Actinoplanes sp. NPDC020271 TaxID=3363896 RepID=UPI0037B11EA5